MTGWHPLLTAWHWEPSIVNGCALLTGLYLGLARPLTARALLFLAGVLLLLVSLVSPLDLLADRYLFSLHMLQHMLLILVVPPLLLLGLPPRAVQRWRTRLPRLRPLRFVSRPPIVWTAFTGTLWLWHLPALYEAALQHEQLHAAEHLLFLATATLFWWPVVAPLTGLVRQPSLTPWAGMLYLAAAIVVGTLLGIILTFAPPGLYPTYLQPDDPLGLLPLLRDGWGLTPAADQQLGGLLMWIPGGLVYSFAILALFAHWLSQPDSETPTARSLPATDLAPRHRVPKAGVARAAPGEQR